MRFLIIALLTWTIPANAQTIDCKFVVSPLERLHCFDAAASAPPGAKSFGEEVAAVLETPATAVALLAALFALISGVAGPLVQLKIGQGQVSVASVAARASQTAAQASQRAADASMLTAKNAGNREIARLRISWIDKVRDVLSEYHAILMSNEEPDGDVLQKLLLLGTQLDLLLNPSDKLQKVLWDIADEILKTDDFEARKGRDADLMAAGRAVFNGEWKKIKAEMKGEEFQTGE